VKSESFSSRFTPTIKGAELIFCGNNHSFIIKVFGKNIKPAEVSNEQNIPNQYFLSLDKTLLQFSLIPVPSSVLDVYNFDNPSLKEQEALLTGYVEYEIKYIREELQVSILNAELKPGVAQSRQYVLWRYKMPQSIPNKEIPVAQLYLSTICFNHVLTINVPIFDENVLSKSRKLLEKIANDIMLFEVGCSQK
jgi:hypothetical protein